MLRQQRKVPLKLCQHQILHLKIRGHQWRRRWKWQRRSHQKTSFSNEVCKLFEDTSQYYNAKNTVTGYKHALENKEESINKKNNIKDTTLNISSPPAKQLKKGETSPTKDLYKKPDIPPKKKHSPRHTTRKKLGLYKEWCDIIKIRRVIRVQC